MRSQLPIKERWKWAFNTRQEFVAHFALWVRFIRRIHPKKTTMHVLRESYRMAKTSYYPNPAW